MITSANTVFVVPGKTDAELDQMRTLDVDRDWRFFEDGVAAWVVQTYLVLRDYGEKVQLNNTFSRNALNIAHVADLACRERPIGCFVAGVRADYPPVSWCQFHIVQNKTQIDANATWLPHWPQPGLIPRDPNRGEQIERVGYFGRAVNHYTRIFRRPSGYFRVRDAVQDICARLGLKLVQRGPESWNDYSDVDVVLGLRAFSKQTFDTKPPTKLINAWLAGLPFIGGNDSAFVQVGTPNVDFLQATQPRQLEQCLTALAQDAVLRDRIRSIAAIKASTYDRGCVRTAWTALINSMSKFD